MRSYCIKTFKKNGVKTNISQINISHNSKKYFKRLPLPKNLVQKQKQLLH